MTLPSDPSMSSLMGALFGDSRPEAVRREVDARARRFAELLAAAAPVERMSAPSDAARAAAREAAAEIRSYAEEVACDIEDACDHVDWLASPAGRAEERERGRDEA